MSSKGQEIKDRTWKPGRMEVSSQQEGYWLPEMKKVVFLFIEYGENMKEWRRKHEESMKISFHFDFLAPLCHYLHVSRYEWRILPCNSISPRTNWQSPLWYRSLQRNSWTVFSLSGEYLPAALEERGMNDYGYPDQTTFNSHRQRFWVANLYLRCIHKW